MIYHIKYYHIIPAMTPNSPTSAFGTHPPNDPNLLKSDLKSV